MKDSPNKKIIGILGGMGPYATLMFLKNMLDGIINATIFSRYAVRSLGATCKLGYS